MANNGEHKCNCDNPLVPHIVEVFDIKDETSDIRSFFVRSPGGGLPFDIIPGQLGMLSHVPTGESMFCVTWQEEQEYLQFAIKKIGLVTDAFHSIEVGQQLGVRGPLGNGFPVDKYKGKDMLFIGGGIGLAPLRALIKHCFKYRDDFGKITIIYGSRSQGDLCFKDELFEEWPAIRDTKVYTTIDNPEDDWNGHVGFVPSYLEEIAPSPENVIAVTCGPPVMIRFVLQSLEKLGFKDEQIVTTLEARMKCGIGKCGRCNIGSQFICLDGPVFDLTQLRDLPPEW